jgi:arginine/lysine/ornithine decarboxylase
MFTLKDAPMNKPDQCRAPIAEALTAFSSMRVVPFDVPGHKRGHGNKELTDFLGEKCMSLDVNSMKPVDNLCNPVSVIAEAEDLAADAFGAAHAFFMVGGTTSAVQAMILSTCQQDDKIILPRNVHRSVINALILSGAIPVYVNPGTDQRLGIALGMRLSDVIDAMDRHPDAKAVFVNNPTYYGICSDLKAISTAAHERGMLVLADEAHGTHFGFSDLLPLSAMQADADMASVSMHKSGGSLTQSSFLLCGPRMNAAHVRQIINLTQTTSGSYLLMSSLDLSRKNLALHGREINEKVVEMAEYARQEINRIGDYYAFSKELINGETVFDFDVTKLCINSRDIGLAGIEVFDLLRDEYDIQIEFGDLSNCLAYLSAGDRLLDIERLVGALTEIRRRHSRNSAGMMDNDYIEPNVMMTPRTAFYSRNESLPLEKSIGHICSEFVMCYPPGIPILSPGEMITSEIADYMRYSKEKGCFLIGMEDPSAATLRVVIPSVNQ